MQHTIRSARSIDDFLTLASESWCYRDSRRHCWGCTCQTPFSYAVIFLSLGIANSSDATEILCLAYILGDNDFQEQILKKSPWRASVLASSVFFGMLIGGIGVTAFGNSYGRRRLLLAGLALNFITGSLSSLATNVGVLSILRLGAGLGIGTSVPPLFTLCSELSPPKDRGFWITVAASFWMVGSMYVAVWGWILLAWWETSWRVLAIVCSLPAAIGWLSTMLYVPESPRFLALQGRYEDALEYTKQLADVMEYTAHGQVLTEQDLQLYYPLTDNSSTSASSISFVERIRSFWDSVRILYVTKNLLPTTLSLQAIWFALSFGSYGLMTWINMLFVQVKLENVYGNALLFSLANLPGNLVSAFLIDRGEAGRARLLTGSLWIAALSLLVFAVAATQSTPPRWWIVGAACCFQASAIAAWNAVDVLSSELFPTQVRASGMGLCTASGRLGAMLAQAVNGYLVSKPVRLLLVAATALLTGAISPQWLPDATGQPVVDRLAMLSRTLQPADEIDSELRAFSSSSRMGNRPLYHPIAQSGNSDDVA